MTTKKDIISVQVRPDMVEAGIAYAEKSLHFTFNRMGLSSHYNRIRNIISGVVMEGAFRHLLEENRVKYNLMGRTHFTQKDRYDVGIRGNRYDVKGFVIKDQDRLWALRQNTGWLLDCSALVPADQVASRSLREEDVYVFPFVTHALGTSAGDIGRDHWLHSFWDYDWFKNKEWRSLGRMKLTSSLAAPTRVRIGGQDSDEEYVCEELNLRPGQTMTTKHEYFTALFLQCDTLALGELVVSCEDRGTKGIVGSDSWEDVWLKLDKVYFTGWMTKGEFRSTATEIPRFYKKCKQYGETKTVNRTLLINALHPMSMLLRTSSRGPG